MIDHRLRRAIAHPTISERSPADGDSLSFMMRCACVHRLPHFETTSATKSTEIVESEPHGASLRTNTCQQNHRRQHVSRLVPMYIGTELASGYIGSAPTSPSRDHTSQQVERSRRDSYGRSTFRQLGLAKERPALPSFVEYPKDTSPIR